MVITSTKILLGNVQAQIALYFLINKWFMCNHDIHAHKTYSVSINVTQIRAIDMAQIEL